MGFDRHMNPSLYHSRKFLQSLSWQTPAPTPRGNHSADYSSYISLAWSRITYHRVLRKAPFPQNTVFEISQAVAGLRVHFLFLFFPPRQFPLHDHITASLSFFYGWAFGVVANLGLIWIKLLRVPLPQSFVDMYFHLSRVNRSEIIGS